MPLIAAQASGESPSAGLELAHVHHSHFDVSFGGEVVARYVYRPAMAQLESPKPYLEPLRTLGGDLVTAYRPHDHPWHKGLWFAPSHVDDQNFWGGHTYVGPPDAPSSGYRQLDNNGSMDHEGFELLTARPSTVGAVENIGWFSIDRRQLADERRELTFDFAGAADGAWFLHLATTVTNCADTPLILSSPTVHGRPQAGYGGLGWRGPRSFTGGEIIGAGGRSGPGLMGESGKWLAFIGRHDGTGRSSTIAVVDEAGVPQVPTKWFVRSEPYAMISAAPFFYEAATVAPGEQLRLGWSVIIADGAWDESGIEKYIASFGVDSRRGTNGVATPPSGGER
jgi:hypothetical protein